MKKFTYKILIYNVNILIFRKRLNHEPALFIQTIIIKKKV